MEGILPKSGSNGSSNEGTPLEELDALFPVKPRSSGMGAAVKVVSNFYPMKVRDQRTTLFEYQVKTTP